MQEVLFKNKVHHFVKKDRRPTKNDWINSIDQTITRGRTLHSVPVDDDH